jgi:hypothetical protein
VDTKFQIIAPGDDSLIFPIERFACGHGAVKPGGIPALRAAIAKATT